MHYSFFYQNVTQNTIALKRRVVKHRKLRAYYTLKPKFKEEIDLQSIKNRDVRKWFTQFRINAHQLAIQRGRYRNIKADERICKFCQTKEVEDGNALFNICQKFSFERDKLFKYIENSCKNLKELSEVNSFMANDIRG